MAGDTYSLNTKLCWVKSLLFHRQTCLDLMPSQTEAWGCIAGHNIPCTLPYRLSWQHHCPWYPWQHTSCTYQLLCEHLHSPTCTLHLGSPWSCRSNLCLWHTQWTTLVSEKHNGPVGFWLSCWGPRAVFRGAHPGRYHCYHPPLCQQARPSACPSSTNSHPGTVQLMSVTKTSS